MNFDKLSISSEMKTNKNLILSITSLVMGLLTQSTLANKWKLAVPLSTVVKEIPQLKQLFLDTILSNIKELYNTFDVYIQKIGNLQHVFFVLSFLKVLSIHGSPDIFEKRLLDILTEPMNTHNPESIIKYLIDTNSMCFDNLFKPKSLRCTTVTGNKPKIVPGIEIENEFVLVNNMYEKMYIWGKSGLCIEILRSGYGIFKNLNNEITLHRNSFDKHTLNVLRDTRDLQKVTQSISDLSFTFEDKSEAQIFFNACQNKIRISQSVNVIALNYADIDEFSQEEQGESVSSADDKSVPEVKDTSEKVNNTDTTSSQPLVKLSSDPVTPEQMGKIYQTDEWKLKDPSASGEVVIELSPNDSSALEVSVEPELSPIVLAQQRRQLRTASKIQHNSSDKKEVSKFHPVGREAPSLIITKSQHKIAKGKNQSDVTRGLLVNKNDKVIKGSEATTKSNINILNSIFDIGSKVTNKRLKKGIPKNKKVALKQVKGANIKDAVIIESQDNPIGKDCPQKTETSEKLPQTMGPTLRTRLQRKAKVKANKVNKDSGHRPSLPTKGADSSLSKELSHQKNSRGQVPLQLENKTVLVNEDTTEPSGTTENNNVSISAVENGVHNKSHAGAETSHNETLNSALQESTTIVNSKPPISVAISADAGSILDPHSFTDLLQAQINNSVSAFTSDFTNKLQIVNEELNTKLLNDLTKKYEFAIRDIRSKFEEDTQNILHFVSDLPSLLMLPESELRQRIQDCIPPSEHGKLK